MATRDLRPPSILLVSNSVDDTTTVPIIVITGETRRQDGELSIKAGADMFLEKPVSGDVLREHVVRLLVACGRLPRQLSPKHERLSSVRDTTHLGTERTCPQCRGLMEYRHKSPALSAAEVNGREPRPRSRYVSGWFCTDPACEYEELPRPRG